MHNNTILANTTASAYKKEHRGLFCLTFLKVLQACILRGSIHVDDTEDLSINRWAEDLFVALPAVLETLEHIFRL